MVCEGQTADPLNTAARTIKTTNIMAKTKSGTLYYQLYQNNANGSPTFGQWYARVKNMGTVTFEEMIDHMTEHNLGFPRGTVSGVMMGFIDCLTELLAQGKKVELGDLGTFSLSLRNKQGSKTYKDYNATENIDSCAMQFQPSQKKASDMSRSAWSQGMQYKNFTSLLSEEQRKAYLVSIGAEEPDTTE